MKKSMNTFVYCTFTWVIGTILFLQKPLFAKDESHLCYQPSVVELMKLRESEITSQGQHLKNFRKKNRLELRKNLKLALINRLNDYQTTLTPFLALDHSDKTNSPLAEIKQCGYVDENSPSLTDKLTQDSKKRIKTYSLLKKLNFSAEKDGLATDYLNIGRDVVRNSIRTVFFNHVLGTSKWKSYYYSLAPGNKISLELKKLLDWQKYPGFYINRDGSRVSVEHELERTYQEMPFLRRAQTEVMGGFGIRQLDEEVFRIFSKTIRGPHTSKLNPIELKSEVLSLFEAEFTDITNEIFNLPNQELDNILVNLNLKLHRKDSFADLDIKLSEFKSQIQISLNNLQSRKSLSLSINELNPFFGFVAAPFFRFGEIIGKFKKDKIERLKLIDLNSNRVNTETLILFRKYLLSWQMFMAYKFESFVENLAQKFVDSRKSALKFTGTDPLSEIMKLVGTTSRKWIKELQSTLTRQCYTSDSFVEQEEHLFNVYLAGKKLTAEDGELNRTVIDNLIGRCNTKWGVTPYTQTEAISGLSSKILFGVGVLAPAKNKIRISDEVTKVTPHRLAIVAVGTAAALETGSIWLQSYRRFKEARLARSSYNISLREKNAKYAHSLALVVAAPLAGGITWYTGKAMVMTGKGLQFLNPVDGIKRDWWKQLKARAKSSGSTIKDKDDPFFGALMVLTGLTVSTYAQWQAYSEDGENPLSNPLFYIELSTNYIKALGFKAFVKEVTKIPENSHITVKAMAFFKGESIKQATNLFMNNSASDVNYLMFGERMSQRYITFKTFYSSSFGLMQNWFTSSVWWAIEGTFKNHSLPTRYLAKVLTNTAVNFVDQSSKYYGLVKYLKNPDAPFINSMLYGYKRACIDIFSDAIPFCKISSANELGIEVTEKPRQEHQVASNLSETDREKMQEALGEINPDDLVRNYTHSQKNALVELVGMYLKDKHVFEDLFTKSQFFQLQTTTSLINATE